jgi:hypothetical protein
MTQIKTASCHSACDKKCPRNIELLNLTNVNLLLFHVTKDPSTSQPTTTEKASTTTTHTTVATTSTTSASAGTSTAKPTEVCIILNSHHYHLSQSLRKSQYIPSSMPTVAERQFYNIETVTLQYCIICTEATDTVQTTGQMDKIRQHLAKHYVMNAYIRDMEKLSHAVLTADTSQCGACSILDIVVKKRILTFLPILESQSYTLSQR